VLLTCNFIAFGNILLSAHLGFRSRAGQRTLERYDGKSSWLFDLLREIVASSVEDSQLRARSHDIPLGVVEGVHD
jgi:hypothetical protein